MLNEFLISRNPDDRDRTGADTCMARWQRFFESTLHSHASSPIKWASAPHLLDQLACRGFVRRTKPSLLAGPWPRLVEEVDSLFRVDCDDRAFEVRRELDWHLSNLSDMWKRRFDQPAAGTPSHTDSTRDDRDRLEQTDRLNLACVELAVLAETQTEPVINTEWLETAFRYTDFLPYRMSQLRAEQAWFFATRATISEYAQACSRRMRSDRAMSFSDIALGAASRWITSSSQCFVQSPSQTSSRNTTQAAPSNSHFLPQPLTGSRHQLVAALLSNWRASDSPLRAAASSLSKTWRTSRQVCWRSSTGETATWIDSDEETSAPIVVRIFNGEGEISGAHEGAIVRWNELVSRIEQGRATFDRTAVMLQLQRYLGTRTAGVTSDSSLPSELYEALNSAFAQLSINNERFSATEQDR